HAALGMGMIIVVGSLMTLLISLDTAWRARVSFPEFDALLMYHAALGMGMIIVVGSLMTLLISLDTAWRARVSF
ncbi:hypothetical protein CTI14_70420, partial [Methylobacterium radiotolerans]